MIMMKKIFTPSFLLFVLLCSTFPVLAEWEQTNGPESGYVYALDTEGPLMIVSTLQGVYRSTDFGLTWTEANNGLPNITVTALAISDTNIFAGTEEGKIYLSTIMG